MIEKASNGMIYTPYADLFDHTNTSPNRFIVIEGLDGTGKTTATKLLAEKIGGLALSSPPEPFLSIRQQVDTLSLEARFLYYLAGNVAISQQIEDFLQKTHVILDRYLFTTIACFSALGMQTHMDYLPLKLLQPDVLFLLHIDDEVTRRKRLREKKKSLSVNDLLIEERNDFTHDCLSCLRSYNPIEIDTAYYSPEEVVSHMEIALK